MPPFLTCKELCWNRSSKGAVLEQNLLQNHPGEIGSIPLTPQAVEVLIMIHPPFYAGTRKVRPSPANIPQKVLLPGNRENRGTGRIP